MADWHPPLVTPKGEGGNRAARRRAAKAAEKTYPRTLTDAFIPSDLGPIYLPPFSALDPSGIQQCYVLNYKGNNPDVRGARARHIRQCNRNLESLTESRSNAT